MSTVKELAPEIAVANIRHYGESLIIPEGMGIDKAIDLLQYRKKYEEEKVNINETFEAFPYDGAVQLDVVLTRRYGWAPAVAIPSFWGPQPPQLKSIEVAPGEYQQVPWGRFSLPNITGYIQTGFAMKDNRVVFQVSAVVLRKDEKVIKTLFDDLRDQIRTTSIYRGKAIRIRFLDDDGDALEMPEPKFIDTRLIDEHSLVYSQDVANSVRTNLFTPISRAQDCIDNGIPVKRGVLLGGVYGTGKTLAAAVASKLAVRAGVTYVYVPRADELANAIHFAHQYQSPAAVVFCEDIDRVLVGERNVEMDDLFNTIDGIDSKTANIIVVLTTNHMEQINKAMLRPGRLDAVIEITPPDSEAVERLLRVYGREHIAPETPLHEIGKVLAGEIPAIIFEVVKRAKLSQLAVQEPGTMVQQISEKALLEASKTMAAQIKLLKGKVPDAPPNTVDVAFGAVVERVIANGGPSGIMHRIKKIQEHLGVE